MKQLNRKTNILEQFTSGFIFKIVYLILVLFSFNTLLLDIPYLKNILIYTSVALGGIVLIYRVIHIKRFLNMKYIWLLFAFFVSYGISLILNIKYGFIDPLQAMVWMALQYFILFLKDPEVPQQKTEKEFRILSWIFMLYTLICSILSFLMLLFNYSVKDFERVPVKLAGLVWGRLWGVYTDPNYASVLAIVAIFIGLYLVKSYKSVFVKILCGINAAFQIMYVAFSDSRTGLVCLAAGGAFYAYMRLAKLPKFKVRKITGQAVSCIVAVCILCIMVAIPKGIKIGYNEIIKLTETTQPPAGNGENIESPNDKEIGRDQDIESDVSNRRFDLWKSGLEIYAKKPVFGVSMFNAVAFAQEQLPNTYLINNDAGIFDSLHNTFLNVLLSQGIVGFVIMMLFAVLAIIFILQRLIKMDSESEPIDCVKYIILLSILVTITVSMMFVGDVFYLNSGASFLFWSILGMMLTYFNGKRGEEKCLQSA